MILRLLFMIIALCSSCVLAQEQDKDVMVVHSYHHGFFWTDSFQAGLQESLQDQDIRTRILYLDTKRLQTPEYLEQLKSLYKTKFEQESFSAIVVSDNNALRLVKELAEYVQGTPIIFGGINHYQPKQHEGLLATGVIEDIDLASNLSLIKRIQPNVKRIHIVSDHSITGGLVRQQIVEFVRHNPNYASYIRHLVPETFDSLKQQLKVMNESDSVLFWIYYRDKYGNIISDDDWRELNQQATAPIYMVQDLGLGYGAVGGVIQSGRKQGQQAGEILVKVLANPEAPLPKPIAGTPEIKLDYQAVAKWGLGIEGEAASVIFNKPLSFVERYEREIQLVASLLLGLAIIVCTLIYFLIRLKKSEGSAKESQLLLESIFDQSYQYIGLLDDEGKLVSNNSKLQELLFFQGYQLDKPIWNHEHWEVSGAKALEAFFKRKGEGVSQIECEIWHQDKGSMMLEVSIKPLPQGLSTRSKYLLEARDITSRKLTEEKLIQREKSLSHYYDKQPVMMITLDEQNRIQQVNSFTEQLLGKQSNQLLGHYLSELYSDPTSLSPRQILLQPKQAVHGVWRREVEYRHLEGHDLWIRENIRPLPETGHLLIVGEDVTEMRNLADQLAYQARHDLLTDTFNRNQFEIELEKALKEVETRMRTHAMLYLDLDQLKVLNDTAGHEAGDAAIQFAASALEETLPYNSILARMGGDEFAVLLKDCTELDAVHVAKDIINNLNEHSFFWEEISLNLTCSIGIRLIDDTAISPQMVHAQADTACHAAKEEGRNRYNLYCQDDEDLKRRHQEMASVSLVHDALANDRLELFAQQILPLSGDSTALHFEVLVRIRQTNGDYISPAIFMPASERYNIAHKIDKKVVSNTLAWLESQPQTLEAISRCSINLSGHSIGNAEFIEFLITALERTTVPSDKLCFEITETAAMNNMNLAIKVFGRLKELGCVIALDDFGSGLSSFGYLKKLPVDVVKIDGLFVRDIDVNEMDYVMVRSINDLAKQMGKITVAEFVENTDIIDKLVELGVDYGQGYIIGRPKPIQQLADELMAAR